MSGCRVGGLKAAVVGFGLIIGPASAAPEASPTTIEISLVAKIAHNLPVAGTLILRPEEGKGEPLRWAVTSAAPISLSLPVGSKWEVSADLPGFWVQRQTAIVGTPDKPSHLTLSLWPLGTVSGVVKIKGKGIPLPKQILVKTLTPPAFLNRPATPKGAMDCPVDEKGGWRCSLPAATFDLVISAEGMIPVYRWGVQIPAGKTLPLGSIVLERGASVAGWITVEDGAIDPEECMARLAPLVAGGANLQSASDLGRTAAEQKIRKDGFLQLTGVAPGHYVLEVRQPGYPPVKVSPLRIDAGAETFLAEPLVLKKALELAFEIVPALDWLDKPWRARVFRTGDRSKRVMPVAFEGAADMEGRFTVPGQSAGSFRIDLSDSLGNRLFSSEQEVDGPVAAPRILEVRFVTVEGRLKLGDEPLTAALWFGGRSGVPSAKMETDAEGFFHGVLPKGGFWRVEIEAEAPLLQTWTRTEVRENRSGKAKVDIVLPDTRIFGRVIDEQETPVPGASVVGTSEGEDQFAETSDAGTFEMRGLPAGPTWLAALAPSRASDRILVPLAEGREAGPIELRLHKVKRLTGTVLSPLGPVAASRVMILSQSPNGGGGIATTDMDGTFTVELPQLSPRVAAIVSAPGFALRAFDAPAENGHLSLSVSEESGSLEVTFAEKAEDLLRDNLVGVVFQNGLWIPGTILGQWAYDQGESRSAMTLRVPNVAPGEYRACILPRQLEISLSWGVIPEGIPCDAGVLTPGATLALKPALKQSDSP